MNASEAPVGSGGVTAQLRTADGWPLAEAVLTITDASGSQAARVHGDESGAVTVSGLIAGNYTAIITAPGYEPVARTAVVREGCAAALGELVLERSGGTELPAPGAWKIDSVHSAIMASAQHLGITSIHGRFSRFDGTIQVANPVESSSVTVRIDASSVDTANAMRDKHLLSADFLDVDNHPEIVYRSTGITGRGGNRWDVDGELTLCGITRPVRLETHYLGISADPWGGMRAAFRASTRLSRDDFAMTYNQALRSGIAAIGTTLKIDLDIQAVQEQ